MLVYWWKCLSQQWDTYSSDRIYVQDWIDILVEHDRYVDITRALVRLISHDLDCLFTNLSSVQLIGAERQWKKHYLLR